MKTKHHDHDLITNYNDTSASLPKIRASQDPSISRLGIMLQSRCVRVDLLPCGRPHIRVAVATLHAGPWCPTSASLCDFLVLPFLPSTSTASLGCGCLLRLNFGSNALAGARVLSLNAPKMRRRNIQHLSLNLLKLWPRISEFMKLKMGKAKRHNKQSV